MPIAGSPKKLAYDVALGYQQFTHATLRPYTLEDLRVLLFNLNLVLREIRGSQVPLEDVEAVKVKNMKIGRLNQAVTTVHSYAALKGLKL